MKICIVNAHWSNRGDEAAIKAIIREIYKIKPEADIKLLIKDKKEIEDIIKVDQKIIAHESIQFLPHYFDYIVQVLSNGHLGKDKKMNRCIECMREADYIIYAPGGSVINDRFWWRKQLEYLLPFIYSKVWKKPFYVSSPSIGPFNKKKRIRNIIRKFIFNKIEYFFVREQQSKQYLNDIKVEKNVKVTIDSAFCDETNLFEQKDTLNIDKKLVNFLNEYQKVVGMTITELEWNVKFKDNTELSKTISSVMKATIEKLRIEGIGVILIPQLFGNQNDSNLLMKYESKNTFLLSEKYDSDFQQYLISKLYMVIGFRYHSNIFAAKAGIPFLPVVYEEKMESFLDEAGLDKYSIKVEDISEERVWYLFKKIEKNRDNYKAELAYLAKEWKKKTLLTKNSINKFLK